MTIRRQIWQVRRVGDAAPHRNSWGAWLDSGPDGLTMRVAGPDDDLETNLEEPAERLHDTLLQQLPWMLHGRARSEVGIVRTETTRPDGETATNQHNYALATCSNVVIMLTADLSSMPTTPWRGTCQWSELDPGLPVVLGPSAVLALAAGVLELPADPTIARPEWLSIGPIERSPYPPHNCPATRLERWLRPMQTTRTARGEYRVSAALPSTPSGPPALWIESLISMDTLGRCWLASLSLERDNGRWWITQPLNLEIRTLDLLGSAVSQVEAPRTALDRDPIDGESFGFAPALHTQLTAGVLTHR